MVKYVIWKKGWHKTGFITFFKIQPYNTNFPRKTKSYPLPRAVRRIKKQKVGRRIFFECVACHVPQVVCAGAHSFCSGGSSCGVLGSYGFLWNEVRDGVQDLARLSRHLVLAIKEARTQVGD